MLNHGGTDEIYILGFVLSVPQNPRNIRGHYAYPGAVGRITSTAPFFFPPPAPRKQDGPLRGGPAAGGVVAALKLPSCGYRAMAEVSA